MRIRNINITHWRGFENLDLKIDDDVRLICLVGANGTGKTQLLELITACVQHIGLTPGIQLPRGSVFEDQHEFSLEFYVEEDVLKSVVPPIESSSLENWDRTLTIKSHHNGSDHATTVSAGGLENDSGLNKIFTRMISKAFQDTEQIFFQPLDADRAYPVKILQSHEIGNGHSIEWDSPKIFRNRSSAITAELYNEWKLYLLSRDSKAHEQHAEVVRQARDEEESDPRFIDTFEDYKHAIKKVLPHVIFRKIDTRTGTPYFVVAGTLMSFDKLSSGEKEIAFLIGQIDRFRLKDGLLLIDEPELHLNAELIRTWINYLSSVIKIGQVWIATHSLEAIEAVGTHRTFLLERNETTRKVDTVTTLSERPILSTLSRVLGTPAFSISKRPFVFIEGDKVGERARFLNLAGDTLSQIRFIEGGGCTEVERRVETIKTLAHESETYIRIGGIVDRDFRQSEQIQNLLSKGVFTLPVFEVENFFLHPKTLESLQKQNGISGDISVAIKKRSDERAGSWIFQYAVAHNDKEFEYLLVRAKEYIKKLSWDKFDVDLAATLQTIFNQCKCVDAGPKKKIEGQLKITVKAYELERKRDTFWKACEGKEVLGGIPTFVGSSNPDTMQSAIFVLWKSRPDLIPDELIELRSFLKTLI